MATTQTSPTKDATVCVKCGGHGIITKTWRPRYCSCPTGKQHKAAKLSLRDGTDPDAAGPPF